MNPIYLDNNGTTPVDPAVVEAMLPYLREHFGNPSTTSVYGKRAKQALELARNQVASLIGAQPEEIYFTSGATEANNWVILGLSTTTVTCAIEHPSILKACRSLGPKATVLGVDSQGLVDPESVAVREFRLLSIMHSNNEIGTLQDLARLSEVAHQQGALVHTDAAQSLGKVEVQVNRLGVDLLTLAGHKVYAPKGIGALYIRQGTPMQPYILGAGQERGLRSGTENVAYAVAFGAACQLAQERWNEDAARMEGLRNQLEATLSQELGSMFMINGHPQQRLPNTLSGNFVGVTGAELLKACPGLAASTGPACHDGVIRLSHVLEALGVSREVGRGAVRLSLGRHTTSEQISQVAQWLVSACHQLAGSGCKS